MHYKGDILCHFTLKPSHKQMYVSLVATFKISVFYPQLVLMCFVWFSELKWLFLCTALTTRHYSGDKIEKNVMGGARSMYEGQEKCIQGFGGET